MPPIRLVLLIALGLALGALPFFYLRHDTATGPWFRSLAGWTGMLAILWTMIAGLGGALVSAGIAIRMRNVIGLAFAVAVAAGTIYLIRLYLRALV